MTHTEARKFLETERMAVVSTVDKDGRPRGANVYYVLSDDGSLYFASLKDSHKMRNIAHNSAVAMVMVQEVPPITVQLQGTAELITDAKEVITVLASIARMANANPASTSFPALVKFVMYHEDAHIACAKVTVDQYKFSDFSGSAFEIIEGTGKDLARTN